ADPPGHCRSDLWFTHQLALRLKALYADSELPRDQAFKNLVWEFDPDPIRTAFPLRSPPAIRGEPDPQKVLREINGYRTDLPDQHLAGYDQLKDDGSTTCASWIYCGVFPGPGQNLAAVRISSPPESRGAHLTWGWTWPANRRVIYNRASADPAGRPWSERKKWIWWDGAKWSGYDVPDFPVTKAPTAQADPRGIG